MHGESDTAAATFPCRRARSPALAVTTHASRNLQVHHQPPPRPSPTLQAPLQRERDRLLSSAPSRVAIHAENWYVFALYHIAFTEVTVLDSP